MTAVKIYHASLRPAERFFVYIAGQDGTLEGLAAVKKGGAHRASAAILLDDLAQSTLDNSAAAIIGEDETNNETAVTLGALRKPQRLDDLIAQNS